MKSVYLLIILFFSQAAHSDDIQLEVYDCGPLARGELGVVFSTGELGSGQTYFVKGTASDICPKITEAKSILGYESNYCDNYKPIDERECILIKIFTITGYSFENNT